YWKLWRRLTGNTSGDLVETMEEIMQDDDDLDLDGYTLANDCSISNVHDDDATIHPGAAEIKHDTVDQDCNGYDLTIDIIKATYIAAEQSLRVEATSTLGPDAVLELVGYSAMTYSTNKSKWSINVQNITTPPATVTVSGIEGSEIGPVTVE
ncbi:MAG: MopE-related protein, partial [bacterium]|nr:MopE-related protein [bacterium]